MNTKTADAITERYFNLQHEIDEMESRLKLLKAEKKEIQHEAFEFLEDLGATNLRTDHGMIKFRSGKRVSVVDKTEFFEFVKNDPDGIDFLNKVANKSAVVERLERGLPTPDCEVSTYKEASITK